MQGYNLFRCKSETGVFCAVPEDRVIPGFVTAERWEFSGKADGDRAVPLGSTASRRRWESASTVSICSKLFEGRLGIQQRFRRRGEPACPECPAHGLACQGEVRRA